MSLLRSSLQNELDRFFRLVESSEIPLRRVTASAFCQARKKLLPEAFIALNRLAVREFYKTGRDKKWRDFRLVAMDTSTCKVPDAYDNRAEFGEARGPHGGCPSARFSCAYDCLNDLALDAVIGPYGEGDRRLALHHLPVCRPGKDLLLYDRGYPATWFFQLHLSKGLDFCCRVTEDLFKVVKDFSQSSSDDTLLEFQPTSAGAPEYRRYGLPRKVLQLRALRIRRPGSTDILLLTSLLDRRKHPYRCFGDLYSKRWPVEESFKRLVCRLEISNFSGKSPVAIQQDFHAKVFMLNLSALLTMEARESIAQAPTKSGKERRMNWTHALAKLRDTVVLLFCAEKWERVLDPLQSLFETAYHVYRPERWFERKKNFHRRAHHVAYKPIA